MLYINYTSTKVLLLIKKEDSCQEHAAVQHAVSQAGPW